jgi:hypothetical protein
MRMMQPWSVHERSGSMSDSTPHDERAGSDEGRGTEGTIPDAPDGVGVGVSGEKNTFEPEEDPEASGAAE